MKANVDVHYVAMELASGQDLKSVFEGLHSNTDNDKVYDTKQNKNVELSAVFSVRYMSSSVRLYVCLSVCLSFVCL